MIFIFSVLTQGSFLLSIWEPVANKRFSPAPTPGANPVQNHPVLHISLPDYGGTVVFPELPKPTGKAPMYEFNSLDVNTQQLLINISEQDSYAKYERDKNQTKVVEVFHRGRLKCFSVA